MTTSSDDLLWDRRWLLAASYVGVIGGAVVLVIARGGPWHRGLFLFGLAVGVCGLLVIEVVIATVVRRDPDATPHQRLRIRRRQVIWVPAWLVAGIAIGLLSSALDSVWPDVLVAVWAALSLSLGAVGGVVRLRRVKRGTGGRGVRG